MFSAVSFRKGRIGQSHTTVGMPASFSFISAAKRSVVVLTFGSRIRQSDSSQVVRVIYTTHLV